MAETKAMKQVREALCRMRAVQDQEIREGARWFSDMVEKYPGDLLAFTEHLNESDGPSLRDMPDTLLLVVRNLAMVGYVAVMDSAIGHVAKTEDGSNDEA
jgi:hypothetical protein